MREFLTGLAILVIGVLLAALIAPFVVDFNGQRALIEQTLSRAAGMPIRVAGPIDVRLLPFPVLNLDQVSIGGKDSRVAATAKRVSLDIATMPLLKGEVQVMEALVDTPVITMEVGSGAVPSGTQTADAQPMEAVTLVSIERLAVRNGQISFRPSANVEPFLLAKLNLDGTAVSLSGPWRIDGSGEWGGQPVSLRVSTGSTDEAGSFRVKAGMERSGGGFKADIDGQAGFLSKVGFEGKLAVSGDMAWPEPGTLSTRPWSVSTLARLDGNALELTGAEIMAGGEEGGFKLNGSGSGLIGDGRSLSLIFDAKQIDLDRPLQGEGKPNTALPVVLSAWRSALLASDKDLRPSIPVDLAISVDSVMAGGDAIRGLKLDVALDPKGIILKRGEALLPGNTKLAASGDVGLSDGGSFHGRASFASKELARFGGWVDGSVSGRSMRFGEAHEVSAEADIALSSSLIAASKFKVVLDQSSITGLMKYALPEDGQRGRLDAQLASDGFDLEQLPEASLLAARFGMIDASIVVDARNVRAPRVKDAHAGRLQMKATASVEGLVIDTLNIADIGGANVKASGRLTSAGDRVEAVIDAKDVGPIAVLFRKVFPGMAANALTDRAKLLGPANFRVTAERGSDKARTIALSFNGTAAGTVLSGAGKLTVEDADWLLDGAAKASSSDAGLLLRQIGLPVLPLPLDGGGAISSTVKGSASGGFSLGLKGNIAGAALSADLMLNPTGTEASGPISLMSADAQAFMQALALPVPDLSAKMPVSMSGDMSWTQGTVLLAKLNLRGGDRRLSGTLAYSTSAAKLTGELSADSLSLPGMASLVFGPVGNQTAGGIWPSTRFSPPGPPPVDVEITLSAASFDTGFGATTGPARMVLNWQPDSIELRDFRGEVLKGKLSASLALRRTNGLGSYLGKLTYTGFSVAELLPKSGISGTADLEFDGGGNGESLSAFAASLSGGGSLRVKGLVLPGFDVSALGTATKAFDAERDPADARRVNEKIASGLLAKALTLTEVQSPITVSSGAIRIGPVEAHTGGALIQSNLSLDFRTMKYEGRTSLTADEAPKDWTGPQPQAIFGLKGQIGAGTSREVDAATLANILTTRAVTRELARLEAQEADLRERAFFARRLKFEREQAERARKAAEEARLAEEAKKAEEARLVEEARKKAEAEEAARKAAEAAENQKILDELAIQRQIADEAHKAAEKEVLDGVNLLINGGSTGQATPAP